MCADDVTHAGHPCSADRWCVDDLCNNMKLAEQAIFRGDDPTDVFTPGGH